MKKLSLILLLTGWATYGFAQLNANFTANIVKGCAPLNVTFTNTSTGTFSSCLWVFGNGNTSTLLNSPFAIYNNPGVYTVTLKIYQGADSSVITKTSYIEVFSNPTADFTVNKTGGCFPDTFCFTDLSVKAQGNITQWQWDFSDGNPSSAQHPCHVYMFADTFKVSLTVTDTNGCHNSVIKNSYIIVTPGHFVSYTHTAPTFSCNVPLSVTFKDTVRPANSGYIYFWDFGDGNTSTSKNPGAHSYATAGIFTPRLTVTAPNGCIKTFAIPDLVEVGKPVIDFSVDKPSGCPSHTAAFTNLTAPHLPGIKYFWATSDSQYSQTKDPVFVFPKSGTYNIQLRYVTAKGCTSLVHRTAYINVFSRPKAGFDIIPGKFCKPPGTAGFTDSSTNAVTWKWYFFHDNTTYTTQTAPQKTYTSYGLFPVSLVVTSADGCKDSTTNTVIIRSSGFRIDSLHRKSGCVPYTANFNVTDTSLVPFTSWSWNFAGLGSASTKNASFTFTDTGIYVVSLTATNSSGCTQTTYDTVKVGMQIAPTFTADKTGLCATDGVVTFTNTTSSTIKPLRFDWNFGGMGLKLKDTIFHYQDTGKFSVSLTAWHYGCPSSLIKSNYIHVKPPLAYLTLPTLKCANDTLIFNNSSWGGTNFYWSFGNGATSTQKIPKYQYPKSGVYTVKLVVVDTAAGCSDTVSDDIVIPDAPILKFKQSDSAGCKPLQITFTDQSIIDSPYFIFNWTWSFGDGQVVQRPAPGNPGSAATVTFNKSGYISAQILVRDNRNCQYVLKKDSAIYVYKGNANFNTIPPKGCAPLHILFRDTSTSEFPIYTRKWDWGNGDSLTTTASDTAYTYNTVAPNQNNGYTVRLTVIDSMGCSYQTTKYVFPSKAKPDFTYVVKKYCGHDSVKFTAGPNINFNYGTLTYNWLFGDGSTSNLANPNKRFAGDTLLPMKLTLKDANNCIDSIAKLVKINTTRPKAGFFGTPKEIKCPPGKVIFKDTTIRGGSPLTAWEWNFGDTKSILPDTPSKVYIKPGVYPVRLKVTDSVGCVDSSDRPGYIIVKGPVGSYDFFPKKGCTPLEVKLVANSPNAEKFIWDLANGLLDSTSGPVINYSYDYRVAAYHPFLTLVDSNGCNIPVPTLDSIVVYPLPQAHFIPSIGVICIDRYVYFTNTSMRSVNNIPLTDFKWHFGTGDSSDLKQPPPYQFTIGGSYKVSLKVTDSLGCSNTFIKDSVVTVIDDTIPPAVPLVYRATVEDNVSVLLQTSRSPEVDWDKYSIFEYDAFGNPQLLKTITVRGDTDFYHMNLNTLENVYSYTITATDVCLNESKKGVKNTTMELKATGVVNAISISWTPYIGWDSVKQYEIFRLNPDSSNSFVKIAQVGRDILTYIDTNIYCFKQFYYRIRAVEDNGRAQLSWSDTSGAVPIFVTTVPSTRNVRATVVNDRHVLLQWRRRTHKLPFTYLIYRTTDDDNNPVFVNELQSTDTFYRDEDVDVDAHSYTYTTYLRDNCGGLSAESNIARTILLRADLEENDIFKHDPIIQWSKYMGWSTGVEYYKAEFFYDSLHSFATIAVKDSDNRVVSHRYVNLEQREYCYKVTGYQLDSNEIWSESNMACISTAPRLFVPNVFTINGDNINDKFVLGGVFLDTYNIKIYNRWGELMFESNDIHHSWDGTFNGNPCKSDVYVYMAEATGRKGQRFATRGNVTLLR